MPIAQMDNASLTDEDHPWSRLDDNNSTPNSGWDSWKQRVATWQKRIGETIESRASHLFVLFLVTVDVIIVIFDLGYEFLHNKCGEVKLKPTWLEVLRHVSLGITCVFLLEIILSLFAFGLNFYNPFGGIPLAPLHLFDAFVIITTFVLELILKGKEEEFAALLILLRFWRIVKLVEGVAVGAGEIDAEMAEDLATTKAKLLQTQNDLLASRSETERLRRRLGAAGLTIDDPEQDGQG